MSLNRSLAGLIDTSGDVKSSSLDNVPQGLDSAQVTAIAGGVGLSVYSTLDNLPTSGLTSGDQAFVSSTNRFYISNGSGWYNVALINATPSLVVSPSGTVALAIDGSTPTVITLTATDSDNPIAALTYTVESDGNFAGLGTISQDSSVFTITPLSEDSATTETSTLTFKASDGISFGSGTTTFTLSFITIVANSKYTTLLAKADTAGTDNQVDASANNHTITENGNVTSAALTPYHPGGYSTYFDGTGDEVTTPYSSDFNFGTNNWTVEFWFYAQNWTSEQVPLSIAPSNNFGPLLVYYYLGNLKYYSSADGSNWNISGQNVIISPNTNQWYHLAFVRNGNFLYSYVDGVQTSSNAVTGYNYNFNNRVRLGQGWSSLTNHKGYLYDVRVVNGSAVYTSGFTPPTEKLEAVTNTKFLSARLSYIVDESTSNHTLTLTNNPQTTRFAPYDYEAYTKADYGGSLDFQTASDYLAVDAGAITSSWGNNFTIEFWLHRDALNDGTIFDNRIGAQYPGFFINSQGNGVAVYAQSWLQQGIGNGSDCLGKWAHYALTFSGTEGKSFVNGKLTHTYTIPDTATYSYNRAQNTIGAKQYTTRPDQALGQYKAKLADFRITKSLVYTSNFTPPTSPLTSDSNTLLLTCTNKNDIWDAGNGGLLTKVGNATSSNTQRKFTSSSAMYFDGSSAIENTIESFGTSDFCIEGWFYITADGASNYQMLMDNRSNGSTGPYCFYYEVDDKLYGYIDSTSFASNSAISQNTWYHWALVRNSNACTFYLNGVAQTSNAGTSITTNFSATEFNIGRAASVGSPANGDYFIGYMQDVRITNGLARYTSAFTPPTAEFTG